MDSRIHEAELGFLRALYDATRRNVIAWNVVESGRDFSDAYEATIDGNDVRIEFLLFPVIGGQVSERLLAIVSSRKAYIRAAVGTEAYHLIEDTLALSVFGWSAGQAGAVKNLDQATAQIQRLASRQSPTE